MKKYIVGFLASLVLIGCGGGGESTNSTNNIEPKTSVKIKTTDNSEVVNMPYLRDVSSPTDNLSVK